MNITGAEPEKHEDNGKHVSASDPADRLRALG